MTLKANTLSAGGERLGIGWAKNSKVVGRRERGSWSGHRESEMEGSVDSD